MPLRVATYNGNTWSSSANVFEWLRAQGKAPHVMLVQETRFTTDSAREQAHGWAAANAMQLAASEVHRTGEAANAVSAGVAVLSSRLVGSAKPVEPWRGPPQRMIARLLSLGKGFTFAAISLYLEDKIGLCGGNVAILEELHRWCAHLEVPFIVGGDWNVGADEIQESGWPELVGAVVVAPGTSTCNDQEYDFFVISSELEGMVQWVETRIDTPHGPHCLVHMELDACWERPMVQIQRAPKRFELEFPADEAARRRRDAFAEGAEWRSLEEVDTEKAVGEWFDQAEAALVALHGMSEAEARFHRGRSRGIRMVRVPLEFKRHAHRADRASDITRLWLTLRQLAQRRWQLGSGSGAYRKRRAHQLWEAAERLQPQFEAQSDPLLVGGQLAALWDEVAHQTTAGGQLLAMMDAIIAQKTKADIQAAKAKWDDFTERAFERGGSIAHRVIKKAHAEPVAVLDPEASSPTALVGQAALSKVLDEWLPLWRHPSRGGRQHPAEWEASWSLPPITADQIRGVAKLFSKETGLGWDNFHPRLLLEVGEVMLGRLADVLNAWERSPRCGELWTIVIVFIDKPEGGQRPIGLLPLLARVWSRIRQKECRRWERTIDQRHFWGTSSARGCDKAAWLHNATVAHAKEVGMESASFYEDLSRFYENIGHDELRAAARAWGFDEGLLKALCCVYVAPRMARVGSAVSDAVEANGTVVAGCSCATALGKLLLLAALRAAAAAAPAARLLNVVDDVSAHVTGTTAFVARQLGGAFKAFNEAVAELRLPVSAHKTKAMATSNGLKAALMSQEGWTLEFADFVDAHRDLGGDATSGSYRRVTVATSREAAARPQGRKLRRLFRPDEAKARIHRAGPTAKATWGSAIMGVPDGRLRALRVGAVKGRGRLPRGAALGLASLSLSAGWQRDPLVITTAAAVTSYVEMVWAGLLLEGTARALVAKGNVTAMAPQPWRLVKDPIAALILTMRRIGWAFEGDDPYVIVDARGNRHEVRRRSPAFFGSLVRHECRRALGLEEVDRQGSGMWGWPIPPLWQPVLDLMRRSSEGWGKHQQRALRGLIQNVYWSQARVASHDASIPSSCLLCGQPKGTLYHRRFACDAHAAWRRDFLDSELRQAAQEVAKLGEPFTELFARGLFADVGELYERPPRTPEMEFVCTRGWRDIGPFLEDGALVFVDGSGLDQDHPRLRTAGWAVVIYDNQRRFRAAAWGAVPLAEGPDQLPRDGEDFAVKMLLSVVAGGRYKLHIDCLATARCAAAPLEAAGPSAPRAHLWAAAADRLEGVEIVKVKAHLGQQAVQEGTCTQMELDGNRKADEYAKKGAALARAARDDVLVVEGCHYIAREAARYAGAMEAMLGAGKIRDSMGVVALQMIDLGELPSDIDEEAVVETPAGAHEVARPPPPTAASAGRPGAASAGARRRRDAGRSAPGAPASRVQGALSLAPLKWRGHHILEAEVFASEEARAAGRAEPQTLLCCTTCWGYKTHRNGRGLIAACPPRKPASAATNESAILSVGRHPKKGRGLLGELRSPLVSEGHWAGYFFEGPAGPAILETPPALDDPAGPRRPHLHVVLASFGLDVTRAKELGQRAVERRAERARAEEPWEED